MSKARGVCALASVACALLAAAPAARAADDPAARHASRARISLDGPGWRVHDFAIGEGAAQGAAAPGYDDNAWYRTSVPATAQQVLIDNGVIDDPLHHGAADSSWVGAREWWYRRAFDVPSELASALVRLHVKGVMENAQIYVNGTMVAGTEGMYDEAWTDVSGVLSPGRNVLAVRAYPSEKDWTERPSIAANSTWWKGFQYGRNIRVLGLWRGVELVASGPTYVADTFVRTAGELTRASREATLRVTHTVVNTTDRVQSATLRWRLDGEDFRMPALRGTRQVEVEPGRHEVTYDVVVRKRRLHLWWPNDYGRNLPNGERYLYRLTATLRSAGDSRASRDVTRDIGIRSLTYRRTPGAPDDHYALQYVVNGEPIYMQGGDWTPSDGLYRSDEMSRVYREQLVLARDAHFRFLRVWGGGITERPRFFALASRYGIMIQQEFWLFQATYHPDPAVWRANGDDLVRRLRNYPALARYTGGNELTGVVYGDRERAEAMPYVQLLRDSYEELDGTRGEFLATDPAGGTCHRWDNLHMIGSEGYELAHGDPCDFLSELGMNAAPAPATFAAFDGAERARDVYRMVGEEYVHPNEFGGYRSTADLADKSQLAQAIGMTYNMSWAKDHKWRTAGSLVWAYNDMAPMVGWSVVDFLGRPKAAYYALERAYAPIAINATYDRYWLDPGEAFDVDVHALNDTTRPLDGYTARARLFALDGRVLGDEQATVDVPANADGGAVTALTAHLTAPRERGVMVLALELRTPAGRRVAESYSLLTTEPNRSLYTLAAHADPAALSMRRRRGGRVEISNPTTHVAYGIRVLAPGAARKSGDFLTLLPGERTSVRLRHWDGSPYRGPVRLGQVGAAPPSENLALGKPAYASRDDYHYRTGTNTWSDRLALYATDGDAMYTPDSGYSAWHGATSGPAWLEVDLGAPHSLRQVTVTWGEGHGVDYAVEVSGDGDHWTPVKDVTGGSGGTVALRFAPVTARFVRLDGRSSTGAYDVRELAVYDHDVDPPGYDSVAGAVEVERLPDVQLSGGATRATVRDDSLSDGGADRIEGGTIAYDLGVQARLYDVRVGIRRTPDSGTFRVAVDGADWGADHDARAAEPATDEIDLGRRAFTRPGTARFAFTATGGLEIDYVRLIPLDRLYELEQLTPRLSPGDTHTVFPGSDMSGGEGDKLNANAAGDYIEYTIDVPAAGTYRVYAGARRQDTRGIFQASIDGTDQGAPKDNYAPSNAYSDFDLGTHEFAAAGPHTIRFTITGRNPASLGYTLGLDYVKLVPGEACPPVDGRYEVECLPTSVSGGDSHTRFAGAGLSGGAGDKLNANGPGDYVTYTIDVPRAATYDVRVAVKEQDTRGIAQVSIDGTGVGEPQDTYAPHDTMAELDLGRYTFVTAGPHEVRFTVTGRNPASLGYTLGIDYVALAEP